MAQGNVRRVDSWLDSGGSNPVTRTRYDDYGNITAVTDPAGATTGTEYDGVKLYPVSVTDPLGHVTRYVTDYRWGRSTRVTDSNDVATDYEYDDAGRLKAVIRPGDSTGLPTMRYTYTFGTFGTPSSARVERRELTHPSAYAIATQYTDALGRPLHSAVEQVVDGVLTTVIRGQTTYDAAGRVATRTAPYVFGAGTVAHPVAPAHETTSFDYQLNGVAGAGDPLGRVHRITAANGSTRRTFYNGLRTTQIAADGTKTTAQVNHLGWTVRTEAYTGTSEPYALYAWTETERFDPRGQPRRIRQNNHQHAVIEIAYDSLGRKTELIDPDSGPAGSPGVWRYAYDAAGRLIAQDDPQTCQSVHFCYALEGRMTQKLTATTDTLAPVNCASPPAAWARVVYEYDTAGGYGIDRLHRVTEADGIDGTEWSYDPRGLPHTLEQTVGGHTATFTYGSYDSQDRLQSLSYPDCETVAMRYDATGQPNWVSGSDVYVAGARYDVRGRLLSRTHTADSARQVVETYTYHGASDGLAAQRLERIKVVGPQGIYLNLTYPEYTARGFIAEINDAKYNSNGDPRSSDASFTYDDLGRLTAVNSGRPGVAEAFGYDALGNMTGANGVGHSYEPNKPHQVSRVGSTELDYAANGTLQLGRGAQGYQYDAGDRLTGATAGGVAVTFAYDHAGAKVKQGANGTERRYYGDLVEVNGTEMTKVYFLGGQRVARYTFPVWLPLFTTPCQSPGTFWMPNTTIQRQPCRAPCAGRFVRSTPLSYHGVVQVDPAIEAFLDELRLQVLAFYGARLVSLAVFGSYASGRAGPRSDLDVLVVLASGSPRRRHRLAEFDALEERLAPALAALEANGRDVELSPVIRTVQEAEEFSILYLDMTVDVLVLVDREDFLRRRLDRMRVELQRLGAERRTLAGRWYWVLKKDYRPGEVFEIS